MSATVAWSSVVVLIVANAVFVAAEFSLVGVRRRELDERAEHGDVRDRAVRREVARLPFALSAAQFAISASSLLLGLLVARTVEVSVLSRPLEAVGLSAQARPVVVLIGAVVALAVVQVVLGELFPRNLAIARPLAVARTIVPVTRLFGLLLWPLIRAFDAVARFVTRRVFRIDLADQFVGGHDLDELSRIISASGEQGSLTDAQHLLLRRALELGDRRAVEIMIPRPDVEFLDAEATLDDLREAARRTGHSRFPVLGADDDVLGSVHVKDLLGSPAARTGATTVASLAQPMLVVPESEPLQRLLTGFRRQRRTSALVVDEYGSTAGIITVEDVLEELVGEITDEFDRDGPEVRRVGVGRFLVAGGLRVDRAQELFGVAIPDGPYETVAGFVLERLGRIPQPGESLEHEGLRLEVTAVEHVRITELSVTLPPTPATGTDPAITPAPTVAPAPASERRVRGEEGAP